MQFTGSTTVPQSQQHQNGAVADAWLQQLHRRAVDRVSLAWMRDSLSRYCWVEVDLVAGWPVFRLAGKVPRNHPDTYSLSHQYRQALSRALAEMVAAGAMETAIQRTAEPEVQP